MKITTRIEFLVYHLFHVGLSFLIAMLLLGLTLSAITSSAETVTPVRTATNSMVLNYLYSISGTRTIAGQHNDENADPARWTNWIYSVTGCFPKLWGGDFLFLSNDILHRSTMIAEAENQWNNRAFVTLMWHVCPPTIIEEPCNWESGIMSDLSDAQWNELVTDGTPLNNRWKARIDVIAPYLEDLKDNGVEVLWRPLHEMNDETPDDPHPGWCWWCGRRGENGSRKLYQITHDYMKNTKGLTNLIWVWNVKDITPTTTILSATLIYSSYYPGNEYVDVVSMDPWNYGFTQENYSATLILANDIANGKPIAIGETDKLPPPNVLAAQPGWTWFLGWAGLVQSSNTITDIRAVYYDPRVVKLCRVCLPLITR